MQSPLLPGNSLHLITSFDGSRDYVFPVYTFPALWRLMKWGCVWDAWSLQPSGVFKSHSTLLPGRKSLACWGFIFFLGLAVLRAPPFLLPVSPWCQAGADDGRELSPEMRATLPQEGKVLPCGKDGLSSSAVKNWQKERDTPDWACVSFFSGPSHFSHPALEPYSNIYSMNSFSETPAGRFRSARMHLSAKLVVINGKTWVCESQIELVFRFITNTKGSNSSGWWYTGEAALEVKLYTPISIRGTWLN